MRLLSLVLVGSFLMLSACASVPKSQPSPKAAVEAPASAAKDKDKDKDKDNLQVFYGEPTNLKYKKVCKIEASGNNALETKYTKMSDFEGQFRRRARRCRGANAVIITNMFAFERGSAFADGAGIVIETGP